MKALALTPLLVGCFEGTSIELELKMPAEPLAAQFEPGCTTAVEVYLNGGTYDTDDGDYYRYCIDITATNGSWSDVHAAIRGKFNEGLPETGLSGVEVYGYAGACDTPEATRYDHDLIFYALEEYDGGDKLAINTVPNLSCATSNVVVRPIDVLKLIKTGQCAQAGWTKGKIALSTLSPYTFDDSTDWWGGQSAANVAADGTATFSGRMKPGPESCLAIGNYTTRWEAVSCLGPMDQRACATGAELEAPMIDYNVAVATRDSAKITPWGSLVIGAVWGTGPIAGATVTLDDASKDDGQIVYFDMPPNVETGVGALVETGGSATGASGLFGVYTQKLVTVKITANGRTVTRRIGGHADDTPDAHVALIKL